jgi:hypothetical protein
MAISRFQMNRQLRAYGGIMGQDGRRNYGIGSFFQKKIMDPIKKVVGSDVGKAAATAYGLYSLGGGKYGIPGVGTDKKGFEFGKIIPRIGELGGKAIEKTGKILSTPVGSKDEKDKQPTIGSTLLSGILSPAGLAIGSGLLAGAFTKDEEDPIYTGQDVGLNLQDIGRLANITDPVAGQAIGLRFLPDVEARKFTPEQMAASFAANQPVDFTEKREQAQDGGIMGDQKDFEEFLQDMKDRDMGMMQDQILRDFENYMKRKRMLENLPEAKDGGIMKMADGGIMDAIVDNMGEDYDFALRKKMRELQKQGEDPDNIDESILEEEVMKEIKKKYTGKAEGGMMDMGGMEMDLRGGGFVPMGATEKADDVPARLSKNEFVFTADAVRAAGGGNVDKGADKMYATMKKLEDRVA